MNPLPFKDGTESIAIGKIILTLMKPAVHEIEVSLPDGVHRRIPAGSTVADALNVQASNTEVLAAKVNGTLVDLAATLKTMRRWNR